MSSRPHLVPGGRWIRNGDRSTRMSGYFAGPPLIVHVVIVAVVVGVAVPYLADGMLSRLQVVLVAAGFVFAYALLALVWGARRILFRGRSSRASPGGRHDARERGRE